MKIEIRPIANQDDQDIAQIIRSVGAEFGAVGEGYGPSDPEVDAMSKNFSAESRSIYLVATMDGKLVGGCGIASFAGSKEICELKKLFLLTESRGHGIGQKLVRECLDFASKSDYSSCYLDTLSGMKAAIKMYEKFGFQHLAAPRPETEHNSWDVWMIKELTKSE